jgi:hypothetical protein
MNSFLTLSHSHTCLMFLTSRRILSLVSGICQGGIVSIAGSGRRRNYSIIGGRIYGSRTSRSTGIYGLGRTGRIAMTGNEKQRHDYKGNQVYLFHKIIFRNLRIDSAENRSAKRKWLESLIHIYVFTNLVSIFINYQK